MLTRRSWSVMLGALLLSAASGAGVSTEPSPNDPVSSWLRLFSERDAAARIGARVREALPAIEAERLIGEAVDRLRPLTPTVGALRKLMAADFRSGATVTVEGVVLSRVEAGLYLKLARTADV